MPNRSGLARDGDDMSHLPTSDAALGLADATTVAKSGLEVPELAGTEKLLRIVQTLQSEVHKGNEDRDAMRLQLAASEANNASLHSKLDQLLANSAGNGAYARPHLLQLASIQHFPVDLLDTNVFSRQFMRQLPDSISNEGIPRIFCPDNSLSRTIEHALADGSKSAQFSTALGFKYETMTSQTVAGAAQVLSFTLDAVIDELQKDVPDVAAALEALGGSARYSADWIAQLTAARHFEIGFYLTRGKHQAEAFAQRAFSSFGAVVDPTASTAVAHILAIEAEAKAKAAARSIERVSQPYQQQQRSQSAAGTRKHQQGFSTSRPQSRPFKPADVANHGHRGASSSRDGAPSHK